MNKLSPSERLSRLLAFALSILLYAGAGSAILYRMERFMAEQPALRVQAINLDFAQMELQAAVEPPPPPEPVPEEADTALEELVKEPEPEPVPAEARVVQAAAAPEVPPVEQNALLAWAVEQIEREKYYPASARRAGYKGTFQVRVTVGTDGILSGAEVRGGRGHPLLRRSLEKILGRLIGRSYGQPLPQPAELSFEFEFKLN